MLCAAPCQERRAGVEQQNTAMWPFFSRAQCEEAAAEEVVAEDTPAEEPASEEPAEEEAPVRRGSTTLFLWAWVGHCHRVPRCVRLVSCAYQGCIHN